ncbi:MAG: choice-of-anchor tandem repeat GloVer-containing protein [Candidatus Sulfotelmatobacter sp.]
MRTPKLAKLPLSLLFFFLLASASAFAQTRGRVLYALSPYPNCGAPLTPLIADKHGNLYGTALSGGGANMGCVFELSPSEGGWEETTLYSFSGIDGNGPYGGLTLDGLGNLYGTTADGGAYNRGVAFELSPGSDGSWTETVLHNFGGGNDAAQPECNLIFDRQGNLYGTTTGGGAYGNAGTVFRLSPSGSGWIETVLYSFQGGINGPNPIMPLGGLVMNREGQLYGVASFGGEYGGGAVFELNPAGSSTFAERVIHNFNGADGDNPDSLAIDKNGNLYATTEFGGLGSGTVTELIKQANGSWGENVLHTMNGSDGSWVVGPAVFDKAGNLYAAAELGAIDGMGSVFMLSPTQSGPWTETVLHRFNFQFPDGEDGERPFAGVIISNGKLFGTTSEGGIHNDGIVFEIMPSPPKIPVSTHWGF